jgi:hypothetical protein
MTDELVVVSATANPEKTLKYWSSWRKTVANPFRLVMVVGGKGTNPETIAKMDEVNAQFEDGDSIIMRDLDGTIPAFFSGVLEASKNGVPEIIACFHDDLEILEKDWDKKLLGVFENEKVLLAGFSGGTGLGSVDIYDTPYSPYQLARQDFVSNMKDAEAHGRRSTDVERIACTDGFSIVGRGDFILECYTAARELGIVHHAYDSLFGGWCYKAGYEARMVPVYCHHAGGVTAVGSEAYQKFARSRNPGGDGYFWEQAHKIMYEEMRGVLPINFKEVK